MKMIGSYLCALFIVGFTADNAGAFVHPFSFSDTLLIDTSQNQAFESELPVHGSLYAHLEPVKSFKVASVNFITGNNTIQFDTPEFPDTSSDNCKRFGYTLTSCAAGNPALFCPYDDKYFKECCDSRYKFDKRDCAYPSTVSGDSCGGKFMCYCDRSFYPYTACEAPKVFNNDRCLEDGVSYYSGCVCPSGYSQLCDGPNQEGVGSGCSENGVTKYTSCQCKSGYNQTCSELGSVNSNDFCLINGLKYYNNCKTCENRCKLDACPAGASCTLEDCSGKYCAVGCAVGTYDLDNYWCGGALRCWFK